MDDSFLFVSQNKKLYFFKDLDYSKVNLEFTEKKIKLYNIFRKIIFKLLDKKTTKFILKLNDFFCKLYYNKKIIKHINNKKYMVLMDSCCHKPLLEYIKKHGDFKKIFMVIWNPVDTYILEVSKYFPIGNVYSYSEKDSLKYSFNFFYDFYNIEYAKNNYCNETIDFYFMGRNKSRHDEIIKFNNLVLKGNYKCRFDIYTKEKKKNNEININYFNKYISFNEYLSRMLSARCLIDFTNTDNITFRTIEAIIFGKKYITNSKFFINRDIYNENNILIFDDNTTLDDVALFLKKPIIKYSNDIIQRYDFYNAYNFFYEKLKEINEI